MILKIDEKGCKVYGIDISEDSINATKRLAKRLKMTCEFKVGNAEDMTYSAGYFDKIICSYSLEHFKDDIRALRRCTGF